MKKVQNIKEINKRDNECLKQKHEIAKSNYELLNVYDPKYFNQKQAIRVEHCYSYYQCLKIAHSETGELVSKNKAAHKCDLKYCPLCQFDLAKKWFLKLLPICEVAKNQYFITLTWPNIKFEDVTTQGLIKNILEFDINNKNDFMRCNKAFFAMKKKNKWTKKVFRDCVRKSENTINYKERSYNFHYHLLCSLPEKIENIEEFELELSKVWTETFKQWFPYVEINSANGLLRVEVQKVKKDKINNELTAYVAKDCIKSFKKEDILKDLKLRLKSCKKQDLKEYLIGQIEAVEIMTQAEITELNAMWIKQTKGMRVFNISGFKDLKKEQLDNVWLEYEFSSYVSYSYFKVIKESYSELEFLKEQCFICYSLNNKRTTTKQAELDKVRSEVLKLVEVKNKLENYKDLDWVKRNSKEILDQQTQKLVEENKILKAKIDGMEWQLREKDNDWNHLNKRINQFFEEYLNDYDLINKFTQFIDYKNKQEYKEAGPELKKPTTAQDFRSSTNESQNRGGQGGQ